MLAFLEEDIGAFGRLIHFKNSLSTYLAEVRVKVDLSNPERARTRLFGEITEMETRVKEACSLVEAFLFPRKNKLVAP